jgi:hypothetical protein
VRYCHEARKCGSPEDRVILRGPIHDLEVELLLFIVLAIAETKRRVLFDPMGSLCFLVRFHGRNNLLV